MGYKNQNYTLKRVSKLLTKCATIYYKCVPLGAKSTEKQTDNGILRLKEASWVKA